VETETTDFQAEEGLGLSHGYWLFLGFLAGAFVTITLAIAFLML
jgi:hypothetical protein